MPSVKLFAGYMFVGAILSVPAIPTVHAAAGVVVNNENLVVQTPTLVIPPGTSAPSGITYRTTGALSSSLTVYTEGFLFCANVPSTQPDVPANEPVAKLFPAHETASGTAAHLWTFPSAEVKSIGYRGASLSVNRDGNGVQSSSLTCQAVGTSGETVSGLTEGIFDNAFDSATATNYNHLVNWRAPGDFGWAVASNWSSVPADPCSSSISARAQVEEDAACVAATGVRPAAPEGSARGPIMWTNSDGSSFTYLFRYDARYGPQLPNLGGSLSLPSPQQLEGSGGAGSVTVTVRESFDSTYLGSQGAKYCMLTALPSQLNSSVCTGTVNFALPMKFEIALDEGNPGQSFYVAVTRPIVGAPPNLATPVVGVAAFVDPVVSDAAIGGDKFSGDNVVFGFMPNSTGFPWMTGQ